MDRFLHPEPHGCVSTSCLVGFHVGEYVWSEESFPCSLSMNIRLAMLSSYGGIPTCSKHNSNKHKLYGPLACAPGQVHCLGLRQQDQVAAVTDWETHLGLALPRGRASKDFHFLNASGSETDSLQKTRQILFQQMEVSVLAGYIWKSPSAASGRLKFSDLRPAAAS